MVVWDVRTDQSRYWVITNPPRCYTQSQFASFDYALTFHVGLNYRAAASQRSETVEQAQDQLAIPWRYWEQAAAALARAETGEEFQAVGMLCRQCLLAILKTTGIVDLLPPGQARPNPADFIAWSERIAQAAAPEPDSAAIRAYLIRTATAAWDYTGWLAHASSPTRPDGELALQAVESALLAFGLRPL